MHVYVAAIRHGMVRIFGWFHTSSLTWVAEGDEQNIGDNLVSKHPTMAMFFKDMAKYGSMLGLYCFPAFQTIYYFCFD